MKDDIKDVEKILKSDDIEKITQLFIERKFDALENHELIRLFTHPEIDLIQCLIKANRYIDSQNYIHGIDFPREVYALIDKFFIT